MTSVDIAPALAVLDNIDNAMRNAPGLMATAADRRYRKVRPLILADAKLSDRQPPLPMIWSFNPQAQARALAWYFANKVPKGSPRGRYRRTGALDKATKVTGNFSKTGGTLTLENNAPGSQFVFGVEQVPGHAAAGHPRFDQVAEKWQPILSEQLGEDWFTVTDEQAGVRSS